MDLSHLKYPRKSHRKIINIPKESQDLAEFMGIVLGDGGINNGWQLVISVNAQADQEYSKFVCRRINELFQLNCHFRQRPRNALDIIASSTTLVEFLLSKGAVHGDKIRQRIDVPQWVLGKDRFERAFVRGLVDTDGCLYIHRHKIGNTIYRNLGFCFTSKSEELIRSFAIILLKNGINPHVREGIHIFLYSRSAVERYLEIFGTSNPRIANKYKEYIMEGCWRGRSGRPGKSV